MKHRTLLASSFLLASALLAQEAPTQHLFPSDKDGAPAPLAPLEGEAGERKGPPRGFGGQVAREKLAQLKDAGITREDMQRIKEALEAARGDESVKAARKTAEAAHEKLRLALRAYAESKGIQPPEFRKGSPDAPKEKPELTPEQMAERRARKQASAEAPKEKPELTPEQMAERRARKLQELEQRKQEISPEKMAEIRKVMEGARNDPAVKAAFEESKAAGEALRAAVKAAMLKSDPSLAPLIEKLGDLREVFREEHPGFGFGDKREGVRGGEGRPRGEKPEGQKSKGEKPAGA
jgi:hypothetical protein